MKTIKKCLFYIFLPLTISALPIKTPQHVFAFSLHEDKRKNHPGDYPFPTEMTFKKYADHKIDQMTEFFDPDDVNKGDTIFLADWYIPWFIKHVHPNIKYPYILISNDTDGYHPDTGIWDYNDKYGWPPPVESIRTILYDSKVAAWFCKNLVISRHPKLHQIPIGQNIFYWGTTFSSYEKDQLLNLINQKNNFKKSELILLCFMLRNDGHRDVIYNLFHNKPFCLYKEACGQSNRIEFWNLISSSKFIFCPPGLGIDTVRFWEAIVLESIPVIIHTALDDLYDGTPCLFINKWEEVNEDFLNNKYQEIKDKINKNELDDRKSYIDYWLEKIKMTQEKIRNNQNNFSKLEETKMSEENLNILKEIFEKNSISKIDTIFCKGALMTLRPFQIADACSSFTHFIFIQDPWGAWGHEQPSIHLEKYYENSIFKKNKNIFPISYYDNPYPYIIENSLNRKINIFFDLTYQRVNLRLDLEKAIKYYNNNFFICGNIFNDSYIQEILSKFSIDFNVKINHKEDIWWIE